MNEKLDKKHFDDHRNRVLQWLSASDPTSDLNRALASRHEGSGQWLLERDDFTEWTAQRNSFIWLYGMPGCGKSVLASTIIESLQGSLSPLLIFYFDFNDISKQKLDDMIRSLIKQLAFQVPDTWKALNQFHEAYKKGTPTCETLCTTFRAMLEQVSEVFVIIDALDECSTREGSSTSGLLSWIKNLADNKKVNTHILVTSRPEYDIKSRIDAWTESNNCIDIQSKLITNDISNYVEWRVREDEKLKRWRGKETVQDEIKSTLIKKANGM